MVEWFGVEGTLKTTQFLIPNLNLSSFILVQLHLVTMLSDKWGR